MAPKESPEILRKILTLEREVKKLRTEVDALNEFAVQTFELQNRKIATLGKRTSRRT